MTTYPPAVKHDNGSLVINIKDKGSIYDSMQKTGRKYHIRPKIGYRKQADKFLLLYFSCQIKLGIHIKKSVLPLVIALANTH